MSAHKVLLTLTKDQHAALKARADHVGISLSAQLRIIIQQHLDDLAPKKPAKDDSKEHIREAYDNHVAQLTRSIVVDPDAGLVWRTKLTNIQRAWGKDGTVVLPFPVEHWNNLAAPGAAITPPITAEDPDQTVAELRNLLTDLNFEE
jgi:hypothetical protein